MKWSSVRVRLTLWNVAVLALVLAGFGLALCYTVRAWLTQSVDRDLTNRARAVAAGWRPGGPPPERPFGPPPGEPFFAAPAGPPDGEPGGPPPGPALDEGLPPPPGPERRGPLLAPGSEAERAMFFRRPRLLNPDGGPLDPRSQDAPWDAQTFALSRGGRECSSSVRIDGEPVRVFSLPILREGRVEGVLQLAHPLEEQERLYGGLIGALLTLIPLALLVAGLGGAFLTGHALRPVRQLQEAAAQISAEDLSRRLEVPGKDEFSELAATFNGMVARLEAAFRSLEAAYQQQRRFVGDASHELRTPLTVVKANTSLALSGQRTAADYREALQAVDGAADMMSRIVQDLLLLARSDSGRLGLEPRPVELGPLLRQAAASVPNPHAVPILLDLPATPCQAHGDSHHLTRLFVNLLENAVRHTPPEGRIAVAARYGTDAAEGTGSPFLTVSVQDTGEGIPAEHLPHVCERFYRVDAARSHAGYAGQGSGGAGAGLGLAICQSIVQAHGGVLSIESEEGRGTTVWVTLPCGGASVARAPQPVLASNA